MAVVVHGVVEHLAGALGGVEQRLALRLPPRGHLLGLPERERPDVTPARRRSSGRSQDPCVPLPAAPTRSSAASSSLAVSATCSALMNAQWPPGTATVRNAPPAQAADRPGQRFLPIRPGPGGLEHVDRPVVAARPVAHRSPHTRPGGVQRGPQIRARGAGGDRCAHELEPGVAGCQGREIGGRGPGCVQQATTSSSTPRNGVSASGSPVMGSITGLASISPRKSTLAPAAVSCRATLEGEHSAERPAGHQERRVGLDDQQLLDVHAGDVFQCGAERRRRAAPADAEDADRGTAGAGQLAVADQLAAERVEQVQAASGRSGPQRDDL